MTKPKTPRPPVHVKHVSNSDVELIHFETREKLWEQHEYPFKWGWYGITNRFSVNGKEWLIRSICCVEVPEVRTRKYDEQNHRNLNQLILIQAHELFNCLIGSRYNQIELGMKDTLWKLFDHCTFQHASGYYHGGNSFDLEYSQNAQYFEIGEGFKPHFKLRRRTW
jgi:hypothetical protein